MKIGIVTIFDTSVSSDNLGDHIIMDSVNQIIEEIFPKDYIYRVPTHECISRITYGWTKKSKYVLVGGSNIVCQIARGSSSWKLNIKDFFNLKDIILFGVGWNRYGKDMDLLSKFGWHKILHKQKLHAARDEYTKTMLKKMGIGNVINTGCPTLWHVSTNVKDFRTTKAENAIFTLTSHKSDVENDSIMIQTLIRHYKKVYFWVQDIRDYRYLQSLGDKVKNLEQSIQIVPPQMQGFNDILGNEEVDYIGTRLHAGIRAIQKFQRSVVIGIDNRAIEIGKDCNINVVVRKDIKQLENVLVNELKTEIKLDKVAIEKWKRQFD
jgi:polysaccharide pyruvyl transferase WcaK-like protein